jgi:peroxiredoxin Q/BCP
MLEEGDKAPDFTLEDQHGEKVKLSDHRKELVVLYFYPKANTSGCTTQACSIRDNRSDYDAAGATVIGISPDEVKDIAKFDEKNDLEFTLVADKDHKVAEKYGTWVEKSMYGNKYMGVQRATFIIRGMKILRVFPKVQPKKHDGLVLKALAEINEEN